MDKRLTDFGKELDRPFEVHQNCYDCAGFYDGCPAWPAAKAFACRIVTRLPDVMPGTCGQKFPATSRKLAAIPAGSELEGRPWPVEHQTVKSGPSPDPEPEADAAAPVESTPGARPAGAPGEEKARLCGCGAPLPKGKRCCDRCRTENRRKTRRGYMQPYMERRRVSAAVHAGSSVPFPAPATHATHAGGDDPLPDGPLDGSPPKGKHLY